MAEAVDLIEICPFCGGKIVRTEVSAGGGGIAESMCCWMPTEFIDNYDVFSSLPELLQQVAIERKKAEYAAMRQQWTENAQRHKAALASTKERYSNLQRRGDGLWL